MIARLTLALLALAMTPIAISRTFGQSAIRYQHQAPNGPLIPASNAALVAVLTKNFYVLRKIEPTTVAVVHDADSDLDLATWPGRLIAEKLKLVEAECGEQFRPVSLRQNYRVLLVLGKLGSDRMVSGEKVVRESALRELHRLLGPQGPIWNSFMFDDSALPPTYIIDGGYDPGRQVLLPLPYLRIQIADWDERVRSLGSAVADGVAYDRLKRDLLGELDALRQYCPNDYSDWLFRKAGLDVQPSLIAQILADDRVKIGANPQEFERAVQQIANELRPGQ
ncbi:MAG: hypothetical protein ACLQJR_22530 [Stellaceae bacterium]